MTFAEYKSELRTNGKIPSSSTPLLFVVGIVACVWGAIQFTPHTPLRQMTPSQFKRWCDWLERQGCRRKALSRIAQDAPVENSASVKNE